VTYSTIQQIPPAYVYDQYSDDADVQAFVAAFNSLAQGYLQWFNDTPLGVYTSPNISGALLDWIGQGIYGVARPVVATESQYQTGTFNAQPYNTLAFNTLNVVISGTAQIATDDYYKRALTWYFYKGDGKQFSTTWLKKRVARFLYGSDGQDVSPSELFNVGVRPKTFQVMSGFNGSPYNNAVYNAEMVGNIESILLTITLPQITASQIFTAFLEQGLLPMPLQVNYTVEYSS